MPRPDVIAALEVLTDRRTHDRWLHGEQTWPDLRNAIHWLIDDTWWDQHPALDDVGPVLRSTDEALAIQHAVDLLCALIDDIEPTDHDATYVTHPTWATCVDACERALRATQKSAG
jgi:hypothetical protein